MAVGRGVVDSDAADRPWRSHGHRHRRWHRRWHRRLRTVWAVPWLRVLAWYLLSRVLSTGVLGGAFAVATAMDRPIAQFDRMPDFVGFLQSWDGLNYREIAVGGYPDDLPLDASGRVEKNVWAFLPLFPIAVNAVRSALPGVDWGVLAVLLATACGAGATLALYRLMRERFDSHTSVWVSVLFSFGPLSFLLQVAYAESLFLLLMFSAVLAITTRRFGAAAALGVAAAFAHPGALALSATIGVIQVVRLLRREVIPARQLISSATAAATIAVAGFSWPVIAAEATGTTDAYFRTELAWWRDHIGEVEFVPFSPSYLMAERYWGPAGIVTVAALTLLVGWLLAHRRARVMGLDLLIYSASYFAYIAAVFLPQQSLFRILLLPLAPLLAVPVASCGRRWRWILLAASIAVQPAAVWWLWIENAP